MYEQVAGCVDGIAAVIEIDFKGLYQFSTVFKIIVQQRFEPLCQRQLGKGAVAQLTDQVSRSGSSFLLQIMKCFRFSTLK